MRSIIEQEEVDRADFRAWYGSAADFYHYDRDERRTRKPPKRTPREALEAWKRAEERGEA